MESIQIYMEFFDEFKIIGGIIPNLIGLAVFCGVIIYFDQTRKAKVRRGEKWFELKERVQKEEKKNLTLYSFRHSYSLRGHQRGIDPESVALAMRHDLKTHTSFYPWAEIKKVKEVFKKHG